MSEPMDKLTPQTRKVRRRGQHMTATERKEAQETFLEALRNTANIRAACMRAGISRSIVYQWQEHFPDFSVEFHQANEEANDLIRAALWRRGVDGIEKHVISMGHAVCEETPMLDKNGNPVLDSRGKPLMKRGKPLMEREYSDSLLSLLAKARMPEFREKQQIDLTANITSMAEQAKKELLADLAAQLPDEDKE